jgi:ribosomal protein S7
MKKKEIKSKIINHVMADGRKKTSENILLKSTKKLQKHSKKQLKKIVQLAVINSTPIFKLHKFENKKRKKRNRKIREIPAFVANSLSRSSAAVKLVLSSIEKNKAKNFYIKLNQELLLSAQGKGATIDLKNSLQKQVVLKKRFFTYYRWK